MKRVALVFGGSGYIGSFLIPKLLDSGRFDAVYNLDLADSQVRHARFTQVSCDVRQPIGFDPGPFDPEASWIINLAALCREPGSEPREYFDTNIKDAENVCAFAARGGWRNLFFTSTMSSYGHMPVPTPETAGQYPETPYGISKLVAEKVKLGWLDAAPGRRLVICRPGVIFGPRDVGNVKRMVKGVKRGYFFFPGNPGITKAYGYVHDLVRSVLFVMDRPGERLIVYNFAQDPLLDLGGMVQAIKKVLGISRPTFRIPMPLLLTGAHALHVVAGLVGRASPIHPVRVRKMAYPTWIKPQYLIDKGFKWEHDFETALLHWRKECPEDF